MLIDAEHGQITDADYFEVREDRFGAPIAIILTRTQLCNIVASSGASPIIRIPNAEEYMIKRALDSGAHGIMTPMCHTAVSFAY